MAKELNRYPTKEAIGATALVGVLGGLVGGLVATGSGTIAAATGLGSTSSTVHGGSQLAIRGFTQADITLTRTGTQLLQRDGARVFLKEVAAGKFNVIVQGNRGVVTAMKNISWKSASRLAKNYGWYSPIW